MQKQKILTVSTIFVLVFFVSFLTAKQVSQAKMGGKAFVKTWVFNDVCPLPGGYWPGET